MIEILKASAGSGKTFKLAEKYIRLLLENTDRYAYKHILAVTFTNKATEEMKSRILKELHVLATAPAESDYYGSLVPELFGSADELAAKAEVVLCNILHDYGAFAVSTIDRFFQQTLKAFSREIGQFASYQVELDRDSLVEESVDRVLDSLTDEGKDARKLKWLTDNAISRLEEGKGYGLEYTLKDIAKKLKSESHRVKVEESGMDEKELYSEENLRKLSESCSKELEEFPLRMKAAAAKLRDVLSDAGIDPEKTSRSFLSKNLGKYLSLEKGSSVPLPTSSFHDNLLDHDKWFNKADSWKKNLISPAVEAAVDGFLDMFDRPYKVWNTAVILKKQIYGFGIANDLYNEFSALLKEKNVLSIDDTNTILRDIIDGTDTPFIYEKTGTRFEHFLLDEFQDTSRVQWENFRPLLKNSVDSGFYNLVVGDVKQSIYRWRGSDWNLLAGELGQSFKGLSVEDVLGTNWRSRKNIVDFNNDFFKYAASKLDAKYAPGSTLISDIYSDVGQKTARKHSSGGTVKVSFVDADAEVGAVIDSVGSAVAAGFKYSNIAVLVRGNAEGALISQSLIEAGIPVVTDESLKIMSSLTVRRLMSLLSSIDNPDDRTARFLSEDLGIQLPSEYHSLIDLCEELLRGLNTASPELFKAETVYIQSFMDKVQDFLSSDGNGLHAFLKEMDGDDSSISSPSVGNSVRIMTIHKSKGLDFPYVIVPFLEKTGFFRASETWCIPDVKGTGLEGKAEGIYNVNLSGSSSNTLFSDDYRRELLMQYVDNINVVYVAFTRASEVLHVIAADPAEGMNDFSQMLKSYLTDNPGFVADPDAQLPEHVENGKADPWKTLEPHYCSTPLGTRLEYSRDASDFFTGDGTAGYGSSRRLRGIVLHDILSEVLVPSDLDAAVRRAVIAGKLSEDEGREAQDMLATRISSVRDLGWFPEDRRKVRNEVSLITAQGEFERPDRVVDLGGGHVAVIDYKFGSHRKKYEDQVLGYASVYRSLGYEKVDAVLWYVETEKIVYL